jgi:Bifunctional DNA primase/polymerase, N-terminal
VSSVEAAALAYAARGWRVFPLVPGGKTPLTRHGVKDATTDENTIARWWRINREANIGIATGDPGPDVLDVEGDKKPSGVGWEAFGILKSCGLLGGAQMLVRTPSAGVHLYFAGTSQTNGSLGAHHVDFRATGGYVVAAPSYVETAAYSGQYELVQERDAAGKLAWATVRNLLDPPKPPWRAQKAGDTGALAAWVAGLPEGQRNSGLFWAACRAAEGGADMGSLAAAAVAAGLPEREALATIASAQRKAGA